MNAKAENSKSQVQWSVLKIANYNPLLIKFWIHLMKPKTPTPEKKRKCNLAVKRSSEVQQGSSSPQSRNQIHDYFLR